MQLIETIRVLPKLLFSPSSQILEKVKLAYDIPIVTDVHESIQVNILLPLLQTLNTLFVWSFA